MKKILYILIIYILSVQILFAQTNEDLSSTASAYSEDFSTSIEMYKQLIMFDPSSPIFNFKLAFCYLNSAEKEDSAIYYFKQAADFFSKRPVDEINLNEIEFYLAKSYRVTNKFDSAIIVLENLKKKVVDDSFKILIRSELLLAESGQQIYGEGVTIVIKNLGDIINSSYSEHSPVFSEDLTKLIFTSRKKNSLSDIIEEDGQYDEDIYISYKNGDSWTIPEPISNNINTLENEATIALSPDGTKLFIYKSFNNGTIYTTLFDGKDWSEPYKLGKNINTKNRETHATITRDGKLLYFTSERNGGYGGLDIYVSELDANGDWGKAVNLGPAINTKLDEDGPYITPDGNEIYFSSNGHNGFGGFDIYKSAKTEFNTWTLAQNLGYPINSIEDDAFYCPINASSAYYTSRKEDGFGQMDIYLLTISSAQEDSLTIMSATVKGCSEKLPFTEVNIKDNTTGKNYIATPNENGKFVFLTYKGNNYNITLSYKEKDIFYDNFDVPLDSHFNEEYKTIDISNLINCD